MKAHVLSEDVNYELQNGCANITLNRPAAGNALSSAMVDALDAAIDQALGAGARMMVFRGSGNHLCTGFALRTATSYCDLLESSRSYRGCTDALSLLSQSDRDESMEPAPTCLRLATGE